MTERASAAARWLERIENGLIAVLVLAMVLLAGAQILLRNLASSGIDWADPLLRAMVLWAAMLGALAVARVEKHIVLGLVGRRSHPAVYAGRGESDCGRAARDGDHHPKRLEFV